MLQIGLDKANFIAKCNKSEHMFGMGFIYFKNHRIKRKSLKTLLKIGKETNLPLDY
jgi:hypothetical protein